MVGGCSGADIGGRRSGIDIEVDVEGHSGILEA